MSAEQLHSNEIEEKESTESIWNMVYRCYPLCLPFYFSFLSVSCNFVRWVAVTSREMQDTSIAEGVAVVRVRVCWREGVPKGSQGLGIFNMVGGVR